MKKCPRCNQVFDDVNDYCLNDGTPLVFNSGGFQSSGDMPTQYIPRPQITQNQAPPVTVNSSKWLFPLVGVLSGLVAVFGFFAFFREPSSDKPNVTQKNTEVNEPGKNTETTSPPQVVTMPVPPSSSNAYGYGRFPEGSTRLLTNDDLYGKSNWDLRIMRNEIFARHGYIFKRPELRQYFSSQSWYAPRYVDVSGFLSSVERQNAQFLKNHE